MIYSIRCNYFTVTEIAEAVARSTKASQHKKTSEPRCHTVEIYACAAWAFTPLQVIRFHSVVIHFTPIMSYTS